MKKTYLFTLLLSAVISFASSAQAFDISKTVTSGVRTTQQNVVSTTTGSTTVQEQANFVYGDKLNTQRFGCGDICNTASYEAPDIDVKVSIDKDVTTKTDFNQTSTTTGKIVEQYCDVSSNIGSLTVGGSASKSKGSLVTNTAFDNNVSVSGVSNVTATFNGGGVTETTNYNTNTHVGGTSKTEDVFTSWTTSVYTQ